ncbi:MAG TPA: thioredoxin family protein [Burkholderiales bacterium]|nr:thioredoxin family protein [Burkholderiales bacterium]
MASSGRAGERAAVNTTYAEAEPKRAEIDRLAGAALLEFVDASGRRLGRSFGVKLWPTLVFLRDGKEVARLVRPRDTGAIRDALAQINARQ